MHSDDGTAPAHGHSHGEHGHGHSHGEHGHGHGHGHDAATPQHVGEVQAHGHQHHFSDPAAYAERWESAERTEWQRPAELVEAMEIAPGMAVADIGTGTGYLLPWLSTAAGEEGTVYAVDLADEMLAWVTERAERDGLGNVRTVRADEEGPGLAADTIDRGIMINVWHHIEDRPTYAAALRTSMREGAVVFIVETKMDAPSGPPLHYRMEPEAVIAELEAAGLTAERHPFEIDRQYVIAARR